MSHFISGKIVATDTEGTGLVPWQGDLPFAFSFCNEAGDTAYFEFPVEPFTRRVLYEEDTGAFKKLKRWYGDRSVKKVFHNADYDVRMIETAGMPVRGPGGRVRQGDGDFEDTLLQAHAANNQEINHKLKHLADKYLDIETADEKELKDLTVKLRKQAIKAGWNVGKQTRYYPDGSEKQEYETARDYWFGITALWLGTDDIDQGLARDHAAACQKYAVIDAERTMLLHMMYEEVFDSWEGEGGKTPRLMYSTEKKVWPVIYGMVDTGVVYDYKKGKEEQKLHSKNNLQYLKQLREIAGDPEFNPESTKQLQKLLFKKLKLAPGKTTPKGNPSTARDSIEMMMDQPVIQLLVKYRASLRAFKDFFGKYEQLKCPDPLGTGLYVLHPGFRQVGTATGRLSCSNPNMQQVTDPTKSAALETFPVRHTIRPRPGYGILAIDYSNQEMRIFGSGAKDPVMLDAFAHGRNVHSELTNQIWGGKNNELGTRYLARALSLYSPEEATDLMRGAWKQLGVKDRQVSLMEERDRIKVTQEWFAKYDWDIVAAEAAIGMYNSRGKCKQVSFLKIYGGGARALADLLNIPQKEAEEILQQYDEAIPSVVEFSERMMDYAAEHGGAWSAFDRWLSTDPGFEYRIVNHWVQGSAADMLKLAMVRLNEFFYEGGYDARILLQVHDELVFEVSKKLCTVPFVKKICKIMADHGGRLCCDTPVDPAISYSDWQAVKKIKKLAATGLPKYNKFNEMFPDGI